MQIGQLFLDGCILCSDVAILGTFIAVILQIKNARSTVGMSLQTLIAVVSSRNLHLCSHWLGIHYRPQEISAAPYFVFDIVNAGLGIGCIVIFLALVETYEKEKDNFGLALFERLDLIPKSGLFSSRPLLGASFIYGATIILACIWSFFRAPATSWYMTYFCCVYEMMCMLALLPQMWMFHKEKLVSQLLGTFVVMVALNRMCTLTFWLSYTWVNPWSAPANRGTQILTELLNLAVLADFLFYWARSKLRGDTVIKVGSFDESV